MVYTIENVKEAMKLYGVSPDDKIDEEALNQKKRDLIKKYHPDRFPDPEEKKKAEEKAKEINSSYDILIWWMKEGQAEYQRARQYNYNRSENANPYSQRRYNTSNQNSSDYNDDDDSYGSDFDYILRQILAAFFGSSDQDNSGNYNKTYNRNGNYRNTRQQPRAEKSFLSKLIDFAITAGAIILFFKWCV